MAVLTASCGFEITKAWNSEVNKFLTNYIYMPLGGGKVPAAKLATMLFIWLWHGFESRYLLFTVLSNFTLFTSAAWNIRVDKALKALGIESTYAVDYVRWLVGAHSKKY